MRSRSLAIATIFGLVTTLASLPARADEPASPDYFLHDWRAEPIVVGVAALPAVALFATPSHRGGAPDAGHHVRSAAFGTSSDLVLVGGAAMAIGGAMLAHGLRLRERDFRAGLIVAEAVLLGATATEIPKRIIGRCRPEDWDDRTRSCDPSIDGEAAYVAMWSGHTATVASGAGAALCLAVREGGFAWPFVVGVASEVAAGAVGALRVGAGAHSWSDVGVGFAAGNLLGIATCLIHPREPR